MANGQSERLAFVEEFTQASCPPCEASTPMLDATLHENIDKVVQIRYQTSWPGVDPMNADNPDEVQTRVDYYDVTGVPTLVLDGAIPTGPVFPELITQSNIDNSVGSSAPVKVEVSHAISDDQSSVDVTVRVLNEGTDAFFSENTKLRVALVEELISWDTPPGSTSITHYEYVMKTFITTTSGMDVPSINAGEAWEQTWTVDMPTTMYTVNELAVVGFVQKDDDKSVINAGVSHAKQLYLNSNESVSAELCESDMTPSVVVSNISTDPVDAYSVSFLVNDEVVEVIEVTETIDANSEVTVDFATHTLSGGLSEVSYLVEMEGAASTLETSSFSNSYLKISEQGNPIVEVGFENELIGAVPSNAGVDRPFENLNFIVVNAAGMGVTEPIGGFGESENSVVVNFYQWNPATVDPNGSMVIADSWNIDSEVDSAFISFNHAFTTWGGSNDRLIVEVSNDCGSTYSEVWSKSGAELRTAPELNMDPGFFIPTPTQWAANKIDVSQFIGEVVVARFRVVSAWGDLLFLDDINTSTVTVSSNDEVEFVKDVNMFPNPANDVTNVTFNLESAHEVNVSVIDFTGKVIMDKDYGKLNGTQNISLNTTNLVDGVYLINIDFEGQAIQRKLHVIR